MSRDQGTASQSVNQHYGLVCDLAGQPFPDLVLLEANQEHGVIGPRPGSTARVPDLDIGALVRILPNHACATAGQHNFYNVTDEVKRRIDARWARWRGW